MLTNGSTATEGRSGNGNSTGLRHHAPVTMSTSAVMPASIGSQSRPMRVNIPRPTTGPRAALLAVGTCNSANGDVDAGVKLIDVGAVTGAAKTYPR